MLDAFLFALGIGLPVTLLMLRHYRRTNYLKELIRRQNADSFAHYNRLVKLLAESFSKGPKLTLQDLVADTDNDSQLK